MKTLLFVLSLISTVAQAALTPQHEAIWHQAEQRWLSVEETAALVNRSSIWILGEEHAFDPDEKDPARLLHHANQRRWLNLVHGYSFSVVSVGMEFFPYPNQTQVDQYLQGTLAETDFLRAVDWGSNPFAAYREQVLFPKTSGGKTLALNIPRSITRQVSRAGPQSLAPEQRQLLPPLWERGSASYFERFRDAMAGHVTEEQLENYFWSQSLWDDTMAWNLVKHQQAAPAESIHVIVGEFHAAFKDGLPLRLSAHGGQNVRVLVQRAVSPEQWAQRDQVVKPDPKYGPVADFIWVYVP